LFRHELYLHFYRHVTLRCEYNPNGRPAILQAPYAYGGTKADGIAATRRGVGDT
jgi:hypothetical protein